MGNVELMFSAVDLQRHHGQRYAILPTTILMPFGVAPIDRKPIMTQQLHIDVGQIFVRRRKRPTLFE